MYNHFAIAIAESWNIWQSRAELNRNATHVFAQKFV